MNTEQTVIVNRAGREWDSHPSVQGICTRREYMDQAGRDAETAAHAESAAGGAGGEGRGPIIARGMVEYRTNKADLPCTEREYVDQTLSEHGEALLTDTEVAMHTIAAQRQQAFSAAAGSA